MKRGIVVNKKNASVWLRGYIEVLELDTEKLGKDLNIEPSRLEVECKEAFWADEFLSLCAYLDVDVDRLLKSKGE